MSTYSVLHLAFDINIHLPCFDWQAFFHAEAFSYWVKREAEKTEGSWESCHYMLPLFLGTMHYGKVFSSLILGWVFEFQCSISYLSGFDTAQFVLQMCFDAFDKKADLDVLDHPILNFIYYLVRMNPATILFTSVKSTFFSPLSVLARNWFPLSIPAKYILYLFLSPVWLYLQIVEILPSSLVLFILRRIPSKLRLAQYHPLNSG